MRNEIKLTDEQIEDRFKDLGYDATVDDLVFTRETIADFLDSRKSYTQKGNIEERQDDLIVIEGVQAYKGQPRFTLVVIDFGEVRAVSK